jgi:hypothetical protein
MSDISTHSSENFSTERQKVGDAQLPRDTLDRDQEPEGGLEPEDVEDRPSIGSVKPEDYPKNRPDG